jgi:triphosphoribosyl-dephospho-CoA synthetase
MSVWMEPRVLAGALVLGARAEVDLTPKPGLVDRFDCGSHPDLDHARMMRSIELLPQYYAELIRLRTGAGRCPAERDTPRRPAGSTAGRETCGGRSVAAAVAVIEPASSLAACIDAGRRAEARMQETVGTNAHRGYIFLSGLLLLAACDMAEGARGRDGSPSGGRSGFEAWSTPGAGAIAGRGPEAALRRAVASAAREFFAVAPTAGTDLPGARVRDAHGLGGVRTEALAGLPSVFEAGLRSYLAALDAGSPKERAAFHALAALMQTVEDTTAVLRGGLDGLARLRCDGAALEALLERGDDPRPALTAWNDEYRAQRLTMGGVADCLALVLALATTPWNR